MENKHILLIVSIVLIGIYIFVLGDSGIIERYKLLREKQKVAIRVQNLEQKNKYLRSIKEKYEKGHYFPEDFYKAGYINSEGQVFLIKNDTPLLVSHEEKNGSIDILEIELKYLRILWGFISIAILIILGIRLHAKKEN